MKIERIRRIPIITQTIIHRITPDKQGCSCIKTTAECGSREDIPGYPDSFIKHTAAAAPADPYKTTAAAAVFRFVLGRANGRYRQYCSAISWICCVGSSSICRSPDLLTLVFLFPQFRFHSLDRFFRIIISHLTSNSSHQCYETGTNTSKPYHYVSCDKISRMRVAVA